jgi:general secretion pathway protein A
LEKNETQEYIRHRLAVAEAKEKIQFSDEAIRLIADFSSGIPRLINIICDRALLAGFVVETFQIDAPLIERCIKELGLPA